METSLSFRAILLLLAFQLTALAQTIVPIPTRPTFPLQRPTEAGELCSIMPFATNTPPREYLTNVVACAGGKGYFVTLKPDGTVRVWVQNAPSWSNIPSSVTNVVAADFCGLGVFALKEDGSFVTWNQNGAVSNSPPDFKIVAFATSGGHTLALRPDGTVTTWGLGHDSSQSQQVLVPRTWTNIVAIAAGGICSAALTADGTVHAVTEQAIWSDYSELRIDGLTGIAAISIAESAGMALTTNGTVIFGGNSRDPMGGGSLVYYKKPYPVSDIIAVASASTTSAFALRSDGIVEAWGIDDGGQAEPTSRGLRNVIAMAPHGFLFIRKPAPPVNLPTPQRPTRAGNVVTWPLPLSPPPPLTNIVQADQGTYLRADGTVISSQAPAGLTGIVKIGPNWALRENGTVVSWGTNFNKQSLTAPRGLTNVVDVAYDFSYFAALLRDGSIVTWPYVGGPLFPLNPEPMVAITAGNSFFSFHLSALRADGSPVSWGSAYFDELGKPIIVPPNITNIVELTAAAGMATALRSDGTITNWGYFERSGKSPPPGLSNVAAVSGTTILFQNQTLIDWNPNLFNNVNVWIGPPAGLTNVISIGPGCAIVDGAADSPAALEPLQWYPTAVTLTFQSLPGVTYDVYWSQRIVATDTTTSVQLTNLPRGAVFGVTPFAVVGQASVYNGSVISVSLPPDLPAGYTNIPVVRFLGCPASTPAKAVAVLDKGALVGVQITNPGVGYYYPDCAPIVQIDPPTKAPPPFSIAVNRLALSRPASAGHAYQFESSTDLVHWTPATTVTVAQSNIITAEIPVGAANNFYRLTEFR